MLPLIIEHVKVPPIKCQGIKTKLINFISQSIEWSGDGKWIEPFMGSGVVVFNIQPQRALIADSNPHIIKFYKDIQDGVLTPELVREYLEKEHLKLSQTGVGTDSYYYEVRKRFNENPNSLDFLFLSRACFNGVMRFNKKGGFNVPFCKKPDRFRQAYITKIANQVDWVSKVMKDKDWVFMHQDWRETLKKVEKDDFVYLDPPYIGRFADYYNQWANDDALDLAKLVQDGNFGFALSMWASSAIRENDYLNEWSGEIVTQDHFYHMGATESLRNEISEALIINPKNAYKGDLKDISVRKRGISKVEEKYIQLELI